MRQAGAVSDSRPLIVTLALQEADQERLDALRSRWFPRRRNHLAAHVTLFHALPAHAEAGVRSMLRGAARRAPFAVDVAAVRPLGRGVALDLRSDDLERLHAGLLDSALDAFGDEVTRQDRQRLRALVTVANKLDPAGAREALEAVSAGFTPWTAHATGLALWRYDGGPWEAAGTEAFTSGRATA